MASNAEKLAGGIMLVLAVAGVVFGLAVAFYASWLLPGEIDGGQNPAGIPRRLVQFAFACAVPILAGLAARASVRVIKRKGSAFRPLLALFGSLVAFGGWVFTFFDWSA